MNKSAIVDQVEGGQNRKDLSDLTPLEIGEAVWQHLSAVSVENIATKLNVKLWQMKTYFDRLERAIEIEDDKYDYTKDPVNFPENIR